MTKTTLKEFDVAEFLDSPEVIAAYLEAAFEEDDPDLIFDTFAKITRGKGMDEIGRKTGLSRESLYKALSADGNPEFATVLKVLRALDLKLVAKAA